MENKKVFIGSDHAGFKLKEKIKKVLLEKKFEVIDKGTNSEENCDYPDYAKKVAKEVSKGKCFGVLICGTGIGMSMTANRFPKVRAALCCTKEMAVMTRKHNNANVLCLGARLIEEKTALEIVKTFFETENSKEERHIRRVCKIEKEEN